MKQYVYWIAAELETVVLFMMGVSGRAQIIMFLMAHGLAMLTTYLIFFSVIGTDRFLKSRIIARAFIWFLAVVTAVPITGPAVSLFVILFLRFFPVYPVRTESFEKINRDVLVVMQKRFEGRTLPVTEALLIRGLDRENSLKMVALIGEMGWKPVKSNLLRYIIRLSPFQNVVLMAIDMLRKQMDVILTEISTLEAEKNPDRTILNRLANLYHEIVYLDLCEPVMKQVYQEKACRYALRAFRESGGSEAEALLSVRYLLEMDRVEEARAVYDRIRETGEYFFPKWVTYEFEFSVRQQDQAAFHDLYLLIESAGGVFIPQRVKEAAKAWQKLLTSAWL